VLTFKLQNKTPKLTYGCLEPTMLTQMAKYLETVYVSAGKVPQTASSTDEPSPDLADYLNGESKWQKFQLWADNRENNSDMTGRTRCQIRSINCSWRNFSRPETAGGAHYNPKEPARQGRPNVDYLRPIIADADTGHGGLTAVMKLTKLFIERVLPVFTSRTKLQELRNADIWLAKSWCLLVNTSTDW